MLAAKALGGTGDNGQPLIFVLHTERYTVSSYTATGRKRRFALTMSLAQIEKELRTSGQRGLMWIEDTDHPASRHTGTV